MKKILVVSLVAVTFIASAFIITSGPAAGFGGKAPVCTNANSCPSPTPAAI